MSFYYEEHSVTIVEVVNDSTFIIACAYCDGTGVDPWLFDPRTSEVLEWSGSDCSRCNGRGVLRVHADDALVPHGPCRGTGRQSNGVHFERVPVTWCKKCSGLGCVSLTGQVYKIHS